MRDGNPPRTLVRRRDGRMLGGVCTGAADHFGLDVTLVRVIWTAATVLTGGTGFLAYLAAWAIIPDEGQKSSLAENTVSESRTPGQADEGIAPADIPITAHATVGPGSPGGQPHP